MRWSAPRTPDILGVTNKFQLYNRILQRNVTLIQGFGTPVTYYRNMSITPEGTLPKTNYTKCYCWTSASTGPQKDHELCGGSGLLSVRDSNGNDLGGSYQKYGYRQHTVASVSTLTLSSAFLVKSGTRAENYGISGTSVSESITTERFLLDNFLAVDYFLVKDNFDLDTSKVEYYYSLNDTTWIPITMTSYSNTTIATRQGALSFTEGTTHIRFKITLRKKAATSPSSIWNSIKFRYRKMKTLREIDPRFDIDIPAFLAVRQQQKMLVEGGADGGGWLTRFPLQWKCLPDATVENGDILKFLEGTYVGYIFESTNILKASYGQNQQILHREFESVYLRDSNDVMKIAHYFL